MLIELVSVSGSYYANIAHFNQFLSSCNFCLSLDFSSTTSLFKEVTSFANSGMVVYWDFASLLYLIKDFVFLSKEAS